jgi:gamma-glutamylputrescine oxidase
VGREDASRLWQLYEDAKQLLARRVQCHRIDCDLKWGYLLAAVKPAHLHDLSATLAEWQERYGYPYGRLLDREETRRMVDCPRYRGGLFDEGGGQLHPLNYALGLASAAEAAGAVLHEASPVRAVEPGDRPVCVTDRGRVRARVGVVLAGNAYLAPPSPEAARLMRSRIMPVGTYMVATEPMSEERARATVPADVPVADLLFVLNYYRLSADRRMLFGGLVNYSGVDRAGLARSLRRTMLHYFPQLADLKIDSAWGGNVAITRNRLPHLGRLDRNILFAQGFSGNGVALTGMAGRVMAQALAGRAERFDVFARLPHRPFPGGRTFRVPALVLATTWLRLRDLLA